MTIFYCDICDTEYDVIKVVDSHSRILGMIVNRQEPTLLVMNESDKTFLMLEYMLKGYIGISCDVCGSVINIVDYTTIEAAIFSLILDKAFDNIVYWMDYFGD